MSYVVKRWEISPQIEGTDGEVALIEGRRPGFWAWALTLLKLSPTLSIRVSTSLARTRHSSLAGAETFTVPLAQMSSFRVGIAYPWWQTLALLAGLSLFAFRLFPETSLWLERRDDEARAAAYQEAAQLRAAHDAAVAEWSARTALARQAHETAMVAWRAATDVAEVDWMRTIRYGDANDNAPLLRCPRAPADAQTAADRLAPPPYRIGTPICGAALRDGVIDASGGLVQLGESWVGFVAFTIGRPEPARAERAAQPPPEAPPTEPHPVMARAAQLVTEAEWAWMAPGARGARLVLRCGPLQEPGGPAPVVVGSNPYSMSTSPCFAARHAGLIEGEGGDAILFVDPEPAVLTGSSANGLSSNPSTTSTPQPCFRIEPISGDHVSHPTGLHWTLRFLASALMVLLGLAVALAITIVYFLYARRFFLEIVEAGGPRHRFVFRPSVIEGQTVDISRFEELAQLFDGLLTAARDTGVAP